MPDTNLKIWSRIPADSWLELWVESSDTAFVAAARLLQRDGGEETWTHGQLFPGPKRKELKAGVGWSIRFRVGFTGTAATATLCGRVVKPDGSVYATPYRYSVHGSRSDVERATLIAVTSGP